MEEEASVQCADESVREECVDQRFKTVLKVVIGAAGLEGHAAEDVGVPKGRLARLSLEVLCEAVKGNGLANEIGPDVHLAFYDIPAVDEHGQRSDDQAEQGILDQWMKALGRTFLPAPVPSMDSAPFRSWLSALLRHEYALEDYFRGMKEGHDR